MKILCSCVVLSLLQFQRGETQSIIPRVERLSSYAVSNTNPLPGSMFFVPLGQAVRFYCYCQDYAMVQILHNDTVVHPWQTCSTILHIVHTVSISDEGMYTCRVKDATNYICDRPLGNLSTINTSVIEAESQQYGVLHTHTRLNCSSTLNKFQYLINYEWFRRYGEIKAHLKGWPEFERTNSSHEGHYICQVYIGSMDIRIEKTVEFQITDPPPTTETPSTSRTPLTLMTPVNIAINQTASSALRDTLKPQSAFWLLSIIISLLGT